MTDLVIEVEDELTGVLNELDEINIQINELKQKREQLTKLKDDLLEYKALKNSRELAEQNWDKENYPWSTSLRRILKSIFKIVDFRSQQLKVINATMSKHDVLFLAPTGGGKSLCFQLPAVASDGLTVVISPLISLMEDQVWSMKKLGISVELLCSTSSKEEINHILKMMNTKSPISQLKILYVTPERLAKSKRFMAALQKCNIEEKLNRFAIDEVHCCSQWGHDFRPDYKFLGNLKSMFPNVPVLGVTATATSKVIIDVQKILRIPDCLILRAPFNRPNLYYQILEKPAEKEQVYNLISRLLKERYNKKSGIIYTFSIKDAEDLASQLITRGVCVRPYHASLDAARRTKIHTKWLAGSIQAVVATVAFGMGIDKPDVRFVIHHTISKSMENFYQESGRAGRDGEKAECLLLYRFADIFKITTMMFTEHHGLRNAYSMIDYCIEAKKCRRNLISKHFEDVWDDKECNKMCDRCHFLDSYQPKMIDISKYCLELCEIIDRADSLDQKLTGLKLIDAWYHKGASNLRIFNIKPPAIDRYYAEQIIAKLIIDGYLKEDFQYTAYNTISYIKRGQNILERNTKILFNGARVFDLPTPSWNSDDCLFVSEDTLDTVTSSRRSSDAAKLAKKRNSSEISVPDENVVQPYIIDGSITSISVEDHDGSSRKKRLSSLDKKVSKVIRQEANRRTLLESFENDDVLDEISDSNVKCEDVKTDTIIEID